MTKKFDKIFIVVLFALLIAVSCAMGLVESISIRAVGDFASGTGTASDPFVVSNAQEFNNVRYHMDKHFVQVDNIDLSTYQNFGMFGSNNYPFTGVYDGNKYLIKNFDINMPSTSGVGLWSYNFGTIKNVQIQNANVNGAENVGAIVGVNKGIISGVVVNADIQGKIGVGGIVGYNDNVIFDSVNYGSVRAIQNYVGGIAGINSKNIANSYNAGFVSADIYVGGIVGLNDGRQSDATVDRVYNIGEVEGRAKGELVGDNIEGWIKYGRWIEGKNGVGGAGFNFYTNKTVSTKGFNQSEIANRVAFADWADWNESWQVIPSIEHPILQAEYVKVKQVAFASGDTITLKPEQSIKLDAQVLPTHSTIQQIEYTILVGSNYCSLDSEGIITILPNAKVGDTIVVQGRAEGVSSTQTIRIAKVPVQSVRLLAEDNKTSIYPGGKINFIVETLPTNATNREVRYSVDSPFADISLNGEFIVDINAPIGITVTVSVFSYDNSSISDEHTVVVVEPTVNSVVITNTIQEFKVTQSLQLVGVATTQNSTSTAVNFKIVDATAQNATLVDNTLYATSVGSVTVVAEYKGVISQEYTFKVLPEPTTAVSFDNIDTFSIYDSLTLKVKITPTNATVERVIYSIIGDNDIGAVINGNILSASSVGSVTVQATVVDVAYNHRAQMSATMTIYAENNGGQYVPVEDIRLLSLTEFKVTQSLQLSALVLPMDASNQNVTFSVYSQDDTGATIQDGILKATNIGTVKIQMQAGPFVKLVDIKVLKERVTSVVFDSIDTFRLDDSLQLNATVLPFNATFKDVVFSIDRQNTTASGAYIDNNNVLTAIGVGEIAVKATVDDYTSTKVFKATKVPVTSVQLTSEKAFKHTKTDYKLTAQVFPLNATNQTITFAIDYANTDASGVELDGDNLRATGVGVITVLLEVDGLKWKETISVIKEPVIGISDLQTELHTVVPDETVFRTSGQLWLTADIYPLNATNQSILVEIINTTSDSGLDIGASLAIGSKQGRKIETIAGAMVILTAKFDGTVTIRITSIDNPNIFRDFDIVIAEEFVDQIELASNPAKEPNTGILLYGDRQPDKVYDIDSQNSYYDEVVVRQGDNFAVRGLIFAKYSQVVPTYSQQFLIYYKDQADYDKGVYSVVKDGVYNAHINTDGFDINTSNILYIRSYAPMTAFYIAVLSQNGADGDIISAPVKVTILLMNYQDVENIRIITQDDLNDSTQKFEPYVVEGTMGVFLADGASGTPAFAEITGFKGYEVTVKSLGQELFKTMVTRQIDSSTVKGISAQLYLKLYRYALQELNISVIAKFGGTFDYDANESAQSDRNWTYDYQVPTDNFKGIGSKKVTVDGVERVVASVTIPTQQVAQNNIAGVQSVGMQNGSVVINYDSDNQVPTVVLYDFSMDSSVNFGTTVTAGKNLAAMYVYNGNDTVHTNINFIFDNQDMEFDLTLDGIKFVAFDNTDLDFRDAIWVRGDGKINLDIKNVVSLTGLDGRDGTDGADGNSYVGRAANGQKGNDGEVNWNPFGGDGHNGRPGGNGQSGTKDDVDGFDGTDGVNGGFAIRLGSGNESEDKSAQINITVQSLASLTLIAGNGGDGGNGGNGGNGLAGGNGGNGGNGSYQYMVLWSHPGNGGDGGNGGNGGRGGNAGNGGNAGHYGLPINASKVANLSSVTTISASNGVVGVAGNAGVGGAAGNGGKGGAGKAFLFDKGDDGKNGKGGTAGSNGNVASDGSVNTIEKL